MTEADALRNLRHALANLRRILGDARAATPILQVSRYTIQINPAAEVRIDVVEFQHHLAAAERGEEPIRHRRSAIALYRGAFLQGLQVRHSSPWEEWLVLTREAFSQQLAEALRALVWDLEGEGKIAQALRYAQRWVQHTPWNEEAHRQLIRLLALDGQRAAALVQYDRCRRLLEEELGLEPEPATAALAQAIRDNTFPPTAPRSAHLLPSSPAVVPTSPFPFVAREAEMARLQGFLHAALAGQTQFAFITGEAGSGKSALAAAFGRQVLADHREVAVAWGESNAFAGQGDLLLPFRDMLLAFIGDPAAMRLGFALGERYPRRLQRLLPIAIPTLLEEGEDLIDALALRTTLMTQIEAFFPPGVRKQTLLRRLRQQHTPGTASIPSQSQRFTQFTHFLSRFARQAPLVLILDDLQWADAGSLSLLYHLGHRLRTSPVLIVGVFRNEDVLNPAPGVDIHPLALIVREFQRRGGDIIIDLNQSAGRAFIDAYLDSEPNRLDEAFRQQLYRHTGGHALFTVELLASLQEQGYLVQTAEGWRSRADLTWTQIPPRIEAIIAGRMARLPERWRTLLSAASVAADEFTAEALALMLASPLSEVHHILDTLTASPFRLLTFRGRSLVNKQMVSAYRFRHILFQTFLYHQMNASERAYWHEKMGKSQETLYGPQVEALAAAQARHFEIAQLPLKAAHYNLLAGQRAMRLFAPDEALALYSRGLALLQHVPESQERTEQEMALHMAISTPLMVILGWGADERDRACQRAYALCQQIGDKQALMKALYLEADMLRARGKYHRSLLLGQRLLDQAVQSEDVLGLALAHWTLGETYLFQGQLAPARYHLTRALDYHAHIEAALLPITATDLEVVCHVWLGWVDAREGRGQEGEAHIQAALDRAYTLEQPLSLSFALFLGAWGFHWLQHDPQGAMVYAVECASLLAEEALASMHPWGLVFQGWILAETGELDRGIAMMEAGMQGWRETGAVSGLTCQGLPLARAYLRAGEKEKARSLIQSMRAWIEAHNERMFEKDWQVLADALQG